MGLLPRYLLSAVLLLPAARAAAVQITIGDSPVATISPNFMGLHYNGPTHRAIDPATGQLRDFPSAHADPAARVALIDAGIGLTRVFVDVPTVNPSPGVFDWADIDTAVDEIVVAGMAPMLTLHQRDGAWHIGDPLTPWWDSAAGRTAWSDLAEAMAQRYADRTPYFELLNEPNHLHPTSPSYMGFDRSAELFVDAATAIHNVAPTAKVGGPASFGSWEPATWAKRVLNLPGGEAQLDFVSYHVYATGNAGASDDDLFEMARWWETVPQAIRAELDANSSKPIELALTEFNASSVFQLNGELWTDPRNVDATGGLLAALGWLYSARGGADVAVRFGTTGGFGLIKWPPDYELRPAYHAVRLLHETAGFTENAELLQTTIAGEAVGLEAFTIHDDGDVHLMLVNTDPATTHSLDVQLEVSGLDRSVDLFRYDSSRTTDAYTPLMQLTTSGGGLSIDIPPSSLVVLAPADACSACGDYDGDGQVTAADHSEWVSQFGLAGDLSADGNDDGVVDIADYTVWRDAMPADAIAAPEPAGLTGLSLLLLGRCLSRRSRSVLTHAAG